MHISWLDSFIIIMTPELIAFTATWISTYIVTGPVTFLQGSLITLVTFLIGAFVQLGAVCRNGRTLDGPGRFTTNLGVPIMHLYVNVIDVKKGGHVITNCITFTKYIPTYCNTQVLCVTKT